MSKLRSLSRVLAAAALAAPVVIACGGGGGGSSPTEPPPAGPKTVTVQVTENTYQPRSVTIEPGDTVRWVMAGSDPTHTVTALDGAFDSGTTFTSPGATFERRFDQNNATFNYSCQAHADCCDMKGSVRVGSNAPRPSPGYE